MLRGKVGAFRCLPHIPRYEPIELPENVHQLIDLSVEELETMVEDDTDLDPLGKHYIFDAIPNLRMPGDSRHKSLKDMEEVDREFDEEVLKQYNEDSASEGGAEGQLHETEQGSYPRTRGHMKALELVDLVGSEPEAEMS